jgi:hypothetical protein
MSGMLLTAAAVGIGVWYTAETAYYQEVTDVTEVIAYGDAFPVTNYQGIDADTSPLKLRACFNVDWDYWPSEEFKGIATPLNAPRWFDCFDASQIGTDLETGAASAILSDENEPFGFSTYIAHYPDGRAYMWRQINECGKAEFAGEDLPQGCPKPEGEDAVEMADPAAARDPNSPLHRFAAVPIGGGDAEDLLIEGEATVAYSIDGRLYFACFKTPLSYGLLTETYELAENAAPMTPLGAMDCFDAPTLAVDTETGNALTLSGGKNIVEGYDRMIAVYPDGRAFMWHQKAN